jgi:tetratricopeptide (TPR) repeat protein
MKKWVGELGQSCRLKALCVLRSRGFALTIFLAGAVSLSEGATAAEDAKILNEQSFKAFNEGRYADAARYSREAYKLEPENTILLYNLARACEEMKDWSCAIYNYEKYLEKEPQVQDRESIEEHTKLLKDRSTPKPSPAAVSPKPVLTVPMPKSGRQPVVSVHQTSKMPWLVGGTGAAAMVAGGILVLVGDSRYNAANDSQVGQEESISRQESAISLRKSGIGVICGGGIVLAGGAIWYLWENGYLSRGKEKSALQLQAGPTSVQASFRF